MKIFQRVGLALLFVLLVHSYAVSADNKQQESTPDIKVTVIQGDVEDIGNFETSADKIVP